MINISYNPGDDNVYYLIYERDRVITGSVPNSEYFQAIYDLCKSMYRVDKTVAILDDNLKKGGRCRWLSLKW